MAKRAAGSDDVERRIRTEIETLCADHGLRAEYSRRIGEGDKWISKYVNGEIKYIRVDQLVKLAPLIGLDVPRLLAGEPSLPADVLRQIARLTAAWPRVDPGEREVLVNLIDFAAARGVQSAASRAPTEQDAAARTQTARKNHRKKRGA